jgi:hypothetical protein
MTQLKQFVAVLAMLASPNARIPPQWHQMPSLSHPPITRLALWQTLQTKGRKKKIDEKETERVLMQQGKFQQSVWLPRKQRTRQEQGKFQRPLLMLSFCIIFQNKLQETQLK